MGESHVIASEQELNQALEAEKGDKVLLFYSSEAGQAEVCQQVTGVFEKLKPKYGASQRYYTVDVAPLGDAGKTAMQTLSVKSVPSTCIVNGGVTREVVAGAKASDIVKACKQCFETPFEAKEELPLNDRLQKLIETDTVMIFIKGDKAAPFCKFSKVAVSLLNENVGLENYSTFDIFKDEEVRQGLKEYSDWPTYPQLYVKGELVGGIDIMKEMAEDGSLKEELDAALAAKKAD